MCQLPAAINLHLRVTEDTKFIQAQTWVTAGFPKPSSLCYDTPGQTNFLSAAIVVTLLFLPGTKLKLAPWFLLKMAVLSVMQQACFAHTFHQLALLSPLLQFILEMMKRSGTHPQRVNVQLTIYKGLGANPLG